MNKKSELGKIGEDIASEFLKKRGFKIIERNNWEKWGELDIVAKAKDKTLILVEVKTMREGSLKPEDQMSGGKMERFMRAAEVYANAHPEHIDEKKGWRLDAIMIVISDSESPKITHYENIIR